MNNQKVTIVGGGISGVLTALILAKSGLLVTIIEKKSLFKSQDRRSFSISANSKDLLESYGLWENLSSYAGEIRQIRVTNGNSPLFLHFGEESANNSPMGYMVPASILIDRIYENLYSMDNVTLLTEVSYTNIEFHKEKAILYLDNNNILESDLLIVAEGKSSNLREMLGIETTTIPYNQIALVFDIHHQYHHNFTAVENFYPNGPFASLPLQGGYDSAIVWTEKLHLKNCFLEMDEKEFLEFFKPKFGNHLGEIRLTKDIQAFELTAVLADKYYFNKAVLIGDAAHTIHPLAGQGLNLSIRDIAFLTKLIKKQYSLGLDIGSVLMLERYNKYRQKDNNNMIATTHFCNRVFSNNSRIVSSLVNLGLTTIDKILPLKKALVNYAMGYRKNI